MKSGWMASPSGAPSSGEQAGAATGRGGRAAQARRLGSGREGLPRLGGSWLGQGRAAAARNSDGY